MHGVVDDGRQVAWRPLRRQLTVKSLDRGLAKLAKCFHFITLDHAVAMLGGQASMQPYSVVLTFDDGYQNNVTHALPILQKYNAPAAFFLPTGYVDRREPFWYDRLDYALQHLCKEQEVTFAGRNFFFRPHQEDISRVTFTALRNMIKSNLRPYAETMQEVDLIANILEGNAGRCLAEIFENDHSTAIMTWDDARRAADNGITIGSHTVDHAILDQLEKTAVREQLILSKQAIEQHTGSPCSYFCYPYGNWNNRIVSLVRETGYAAAITTDKGTSKVGDELLTLHRVSFPEVF